MSSYNRSDTSCSNMNFKLRSESDLACSSYNFPIIRGAIKLSLHPIAICGHEHSIA